MADIIANFWKTYGLLALTIVLGVPLLYYFIEWVTRPVNPRLDANRKILKKLKKYVEDNPDQRFGQILRNTGIVSEVGVKDSSDEDHEAPDYYWVRGVHEEPFVTFRRMVESEKGNYEEVKVVRKVKK